MQPKIVDWACDVSRGRFLRVLSRIYKLEVILMLKGDLKSASNFKDFFYKIRIWIILYIKAEIQFKFINFDQ